MCKCGCNTCETKSTLMLNESLAPRAILSEGLKYHIDNNKPLTEHLYRAGSRAYFDLISEARSLYSRGILEFTNEDDLAILTETDLGHFGMFEGKKVPLDFPIELNEQMDIYDEIANMEFGMDYDQLGSNEKEWVRDEIDNMEMRESLNESNSNYPDFDLNKNIRYQDTSISSGMWRYTGQEQGGKGVYRNLNNGQILAFDRSDFDIFRNHLSSHFDISESINEAKMPTQDQVDKFFALTNNEMHYLNSKPVKGQEKTFNNTEVEPWDEYDLSNFNALVRKAKSKGKINESKAIITFKNDYEVKMNRIEGYADNFEHFEAGERESVYILDKNAPFQRVHVEFGDGTNAFIPKDVISVQEKPLNEVEKDINQLKNLSNKKERYNYIKNFSKEKLIDIADELYLDYEEYDDIEDKVLNSFGESLNEGEYRIEYEDEDDNRHYIKIKASSEEEAEQKSSGLDGFRTLKSIELVNESNKISDDKLMKLIPKLPKGYVGKNTGVGVYYILTPDGGDIVLTQSKDKKNWSYRPSILASKILAEAYSGFLRNPEDPDSEKFEPTGALAEFKEDLKALFGKFKGDLKNPEFIKGVAQIMVNWKSLLRSQLDEATVNYDFSKEELIRVIKQLKRGASTEIGMIKAFETALGRELSDDEIRGFKLNEAKKKKAKKNNKKLNKPMRDSSGGKAYKVYVKDPKTKKIKTVRFGSGGLRAKINDKKARNAFAKRHKCSTKKDKTKAGYWSCRLPRYAKLLGLKSNFGGFW